MNPFGQELSSGAPGGTHAAVPQGHLLSNGSYHVMLTSAGGGYSHSKDLAVTRWREDPTCDPWGSFCYIRDVVHGDVWSATHQPTLQRAEVYETVFTIGRAVFSRSDHGIGVRTEVAVSHEDDVELRRVSVRNVSSTARVLDMTSYVEIALAPPATDSAHPAFSNLFVETEILRDRQAILGCRRPGAPGAPRLWMFHFMSTGNELPRQASYETDRMRFIGRGRSLSDPQAMADDGALSGSAGPVLDPVAAIRCRLPLDPNTAITVDLVSGVAASREACLALIDKYRDRVNADRALAGASEYGEGVLGGLQATQADERLFQRLASSVIYADASLRAEPSLLAMNHQGQSGLWGYAISGDLPIVLLRIADAANVALARQLVQAHGYWRQHGLEVDLIVINAAPEAQAPALRETLAKLIAAQGESERIDKPGGFFVREASNISEADLILLQAVARVVISDSDGTLPDQLARRSSPASPVLRPVVTCKGARNPVDTAADLAGRAPKLNLTFDNGTGGFSADGREYVITVSAGHMTPVPWVNVLANPSFGTLVSESGSAATWSENAQQFRLTPWSNDPVGDPNTEGFYIRDETDGIFWSPTLLPADGALPYVTRHGFGYSVFDHSENSIESELTVFVAIDAPVKFCLLKLRNASGRARRLSVTGYVEWVLGDEGPKTRMQVNTRVDADSGALFASNPYNTEFAGRTAWFDADHMGAASVTGDRHEFLGNGGTLRHPAAMSETLLSGAVGYALDPCAAIRVPWELVDGETREIVFRLGAGNTAEEAGQLVRRWRGSAAAHEALAAVKAYWQQTLGAVQVETPNRSLDLLANGWLVYQVIACRLWARNAFYQSSGAFGFRDQLQDVMALVHAVPELVREHLLRAAGRQFREGDVQHWWHPPSGRGVRTHCSDDYLWLPLVACRYVTVTGDTGVLDEPVHFLDSPALEAGTESRYDLPKQAAEAASLYDHCVRSLEHGLRFGAHGLPLMGSGDWNDGMNLVGAAGKGESVWLGFFLYFVLTQFETLARRRSDAPFAERCAAESARLRIAIDESAWDGSWYRRAWFDDGSPLGTSANAECRIDSIAQSWAVLSGAATAQRGHEAMSAVDRQLVRRDSALIRLLDPPFDRSDPSPGYIQGYVKGIRENGGQYTHAAVWTAMAFAALGDAERAWELFAMLDPIHHARSPQAVALYKIEPYVIAGDVYAFAPHAGRGGWSWYTGSAAWMYRFLLESLLGLEVEAGQLRFAPCVPQEWTSFKVHFRYRQTRYHVTVLRSPQWVGAPRLTVDGVTQPGQTIALVDDRREHLIELALPAGGPSAQARAPVPQ